MASVSSNPPDLIVELCSIVERLDLTQLFPGSQPLEVALGCGDASFLPESARRHPQAGSQRPPRRADEFTRRADRIVLFFAISFAASLGIRVARLFSRSRSEERRVGK